MNTEVVFVKSFAWLNALPDEDSLLVRPMTIVVEAFRHLDDVPTTFDPLFAACSKHDLFLCRDWFNLLFQHGMAQNTAISVYGASNEAGQPILLLPLAREAGETSDRKMRGLANYYTLSYAPLVSPTAPLDVVEQAFTAIAHRLYTNGTQIIHLRPLPTDAPFLPTLSNGFSRAGFAIRSYQNATRHFARTASMTGDDFIQQLPSRLKNTIRRKTKSGSHAHQFQLYTDAEGLDEAIAQYQTVYAASWKEPEPSLDFMPALIRLAQQQAMMRLGIWWVDNKPAAAQLWLVHGGRAIIYKLAHDKRFDDLSVGSSLTLRMFQEIIDRDHPDIIDFGLGDEPYKADWTPETEVCRGWIAIRKNTFSGILALLRHDIGSWLRRKIR